MRTYTPGYSGMKAFFVLVGLGIVALGVATIYRPLKLLASGQRATAEITAVVVSRPGEPDQVLTSKDDVKPDSSRTATFRFRARYRGPDGTFHTGLLDLAYHATPNSTIGDRFSVAYAPAAAADASRPVVLVPIYDLGTWTFGAFLILTGAFLAVVQGLYLVYSRTPIPIAEESPRPATPAGAPAAAAGSDAAPV